MKFDADLQNALYERAVLQDIQRHLREEYLPDLRQKVRGYITCEDVPYKDRYVPPEVIQAQLQKIDREIEGLTKTIDQYEVKKNAPEAVQGHAAEEEAGSSAGQEQPQPKRRRRDAKQPG